MFHVFKKSLSVVALASLAMAQPAMATRSGESIPVAIAKVAPVQGQRVGSKVRKAEEVRGSFAIPLIAIIAIITGAILIAGNNHHNNDSPG